MFQAGPLALPTREECTPSSSRKLLGMPDELLARIIEFATTPSRHERFPECDFGLEDWEFHYSDDLRDAAALARVCRRFYRLAIPILYGSAFLGDGLPPCWYGQYEIQSWPRRVVMSRHATRLFHRSLSERPLLREHCRNLNLQFSRARKTVIFNNLTCWLAKTTRLALTISGKGIGVEGHLPAIIDMIKRMENLKELSLDFDETPFTPTALWSILQSAPRLWGLRVKRVDSDDRNSWENLERQQDFTATSSLKSLILDRVSERSNETIRRILQIPMGLEHISVWLLSSKEDLSPLFLHKSTLRSLSIGYACAFESAFWDFDFQGFHHLESLSLGRCQTSRQPPSRMHALILSAPNLRRFEWSFGSAPTLGYDNQFLYQFGENEERWISVLAREAASQGHPLRHIHIDYTPERFDGYGEYPYGEYPWDRMDRVAAGLDGINLSYHTPTVSREACFAGLRP